MFGAAWGLSQRIKAAEKAEARERWEAQSPKAQASSAGYYAGYVGASYRPYGTQGATDVHPRYPVGNIYSVTIATDSQGSAYSDGYREGQVQKMVDDAKDEGYKQGWNEEEWFS